MTAATNVLGATRAMATDITVHGMANADVVTQRAVHDALEQFHEVESACTRFDPKSPLMQVNARPNRWHSVPPTLFRAIQEAYRAHQRSKGRFDPRVLRSLVGLGYDGRLTFSSDDVEVAEDPGALRAVRGPWRPRFRGGPHPQVQLGREPVDLGGIGKGLAIRWAQDRLEADVDEFLIDAGGDIACRGGGPDGQGWLVAVENPRNGLGPLAVVALRDTACATSSIRLRRWRSGGRRVHHLVDPRTGRPGGAGLLAVTVIAPDPADAEVSSKSLFLEGARGISGAARRANAAALWVRSDGSVGETPAFGDHVIWRAS